MEDEAVGKIVTRFLVDTCHPGQRPRMESYRALRNAIDFSFTHGERLGNSLIPTVTGSVAEFYIDPMVSSVHDMDNMYYPNNIVIIPAGAAPPTKLPDEFDDRIAVYEMLATKWPGYVCLMARFLLVESTDEGEYRVMELDQLQRQRFRTDHPVGGPAVVSHIEIEDELFPESIYKEIIMPMDMVKCLRCLLWPPQAAHWPRRRRVHGWPDSATIDRVISNGCDVVGVAHRQCRSVEWLEKFQWRLSFSRAEIVLLNSFLPEQQIAYHMLRFFVKTEKLTELGDSSRENTLSNYHVKTLMLWTCELKSRIWWTQDLNLVRTTVTLLHILSDWLSLATFRHYFNSCGNLFEHRSNSHECMEAISKRLRSETEKTLGQWFIEHYVKQCAEQCPETVSRLFSDVSTIPKLHEAVSSVASWRCSNLPYLLKPRLETGILSIVRSISMVPISVQRVAFWMQGLTEVDSRLLLCYVAAVFLRVAREISNISQKEDMIDALMMTFLGLHNKTFKFHYCKDHRSSRSLQKATSLMSILPTEIEHHSTMELIQVHLSMSYLYKILESNDSDSKAMYCLSNAYLTVLHYITGQYETALYHCWQVKTSKNHSNCSISCGVRGDCLNLSTIPELEIVLGATALYQYVLTTALECQQLPRYEGVFTAELFAHYMYRKCLAAIGHRVPYADKHYNKVTCMMRQLHITDLLAIKTTERFLASQENAMFSGIRSDLLPLSNARELADLLMQSAVEHLTTFREFQQRDFDRPGAHIATTDFKALYAFKCRDFQHCLKLSIETLKTSGPHDMVMIFMGPEILQFLDDHFLSLTGLIRLVNPTVTVDESTAMNMFALKMTQQVLALYLAARCAIQLRVHGLLGSLSEIILNTSGRFYDTVSGSALTLDLLTLQLTQRMAELCVIKELQPIIDSIKEKTDPYIIAIGGENWVVKTSQSKTTVRCFKDVDVESMFEYLHSAS